MTSHNGEPTLYPYFLETISMFKERNIKLSINTNGSTHDKEWWYKFGCMLDKEDRVIFSLDGLKENHEHYRPGTNFNTIVENIESLNMSGASSYCNTVIFKNNEDDIIGIKKLSEAIGCKEHRVKVSWCYDDEFERPISIDVNTRKETSLMNEIITCEHLDCYGDMSVSLSPDGEYFPCCFMLQAVENETDKTVVELYKRAKNVLMDFDSAYKTSLFRCASKLDICSERCKGFICETAYVGKNPVEKNFDPIEIYNEVKDLGVKLTDISILQKKYPNLNYDRYRSIYGPMYGDFLKMMSRIDGNIEEAFSYSQYLGKKVIIESLKNYDFKTVMIIGSWVGLLARMIHDNFHCAVTTVDKDPLMSEVDAFLNKDYKLHLHLPLDVKTLDVNNGDVVINTSCEHMDDEWFYRTHPSQLLILQSTNKQGKDHINTVESLENMKRKYPMSNIIESRVLEVWNDSIDKRFMLIGNK